MCHRPLAPSIVSPAQPCICLLGLLVCLGLPEITAETRATMYNMHTGAHDALANNLIQGTSLPAALASSAESPC